MEIYDWTGKKVLNSANQKKIDISQLVNGVYIVKVKIDKRYFQKKFIVKK